MIHPFIRVIADKEVICFIPFKWSKLVFERYYCHKSQIWRFSGLVICCQQE